MPVSIFALEYARQILNMDELHFVSNKKKAHFNLKAQVGPYIVNTRVRTKEVEVVLKQMKLTKMEENKIKVDNAYLAELQKNFKLIKQIHKYEDQSIIIQMLAKEKRNIWQDISGNVTDLWTSIQIIFEKEELVHKFDELQN